ncbi:SusC/RagA family TonB-linked outer membrane protein [Olivibacter sp. CPCC 100613]|uniref:SusC/RagA family TonB-linked outer membrane protein n=1 Tax=Olivibacter sp. CPCC 100613 TaxID=3079931 RepID=UPI002FFC69C6
MKLVLLGKKMPIMLLIALTFGILFSVKAAEQRIPLRDLLGSLEQKFNIRFNYSADLIGPAMIESPDVSKLKRSDIASFLEKIVAGKLIVEQIDDMLYVVKPANHVKNATRKQTVESRSNSSKVQDEITGTVKDAADGSSLPGVTVMIKGTTRSTVTDAAGNYVLTGAGNDAVLVFSYMGYQPIEEVVNGRVHIEVQLRPGESQLEEVVVTALGIKREEKSLGYAVQKVSGEQLQTVKGVDVGTSLSGKVSGLVIKNSTEFNAKPTIELRGESPLIVIDGVPYGNMTLRDIPTDDIADMSILKGATASALYGSRGGSGAIIITTKRGQTEGFSIDVNSNTMTQMGFLALPEVQTSYGHGINGAIADDYVWGPKLDIGQTAVQWNPLTKQNEEMPLVSSGKDNLKNFLERGIITNNNISITQTGENGFFRTSLNHILNKGQYPNTKLNIINFTNSGEMKLGDKFTIGAQTGYTRQNSPQVWGTGYGNQGYLYQILMWTGPDYDIRQYRDYWVTPNQQQNWLYDAWYDNPYLIAYEKLNGITQNKLYASFNANYQVNKNLNVLFRTGYDFYSNVETIRNPNGVNSTRSEFYVGRYYSREDPSLALTPGINVPFNSLGTYAINKDWGFSTNNDLIVTYNQNWGKFGLNALGGGTIYYYNDRGLDAATQNGLSVPGWYSLAASVDKALVAETEYRRQINSVFGKVGLSWDDAVFVDVTARNDWSSTQAKSARSYFYPSIAASFILSQYLKLPEAIDMIKLRGSWAVDKSPLDVYANNRTYSVSPGVWDNYNTADYPGNLLGNNLLANAHRTYEFGANIALLQRRIGLDITYFNKYYYNQQKAVTISSAAGFSSTLVNTAETYERRGLEITLTGSPIKHQNFEWNTTINWSNNHRYYVNLDPVYSADDLWTKKGGRLDVYTKNRWERDPEGNIIHVNGIPKTSNYEQKMGYGDPNFTFGFVNNFRYKNFMLGITIDGRIGGLMYNYIWDKMFDTGANPETDNQYRYDAVVNGLSNYVGEGVKVISGEATYDKYGQITSDTRVYAPNDVQVNYQDYAQSLNDSDGEHGVQKQSFVKVREIAISYNFPAKLLSKTRIKNASVSLTGQNVLLFTKFKFSDPDVFTENLNSPSQRMLGLNIRLGF